MFSKKHKNFKVNEEGISMTNVVAVMAGNVWKVLVKPGDQVEEGQEVVILESMKMEIPIAVDFGGMVKEVKINEGDFVNEEDVLIVLE
ncbi:acetyl-CoA carboxylase biotin carboxyl carrier protein subunit [Bacillus sp. EB600]|nr:acetyl-CoA carboxylase biotin carboxyl carrier protein subunit [Bacillus sp. EB600]